MSCDFIKRITVILSNWNPPLLQKEFKMNIFIGDESEEQRTSGLIQDHMGNDYNDSYWLSPSYMLSSLP